MQWHYWSTEGDKGWYVSASNNSYTGVHGHCSNCSCWWKEKSNRPRSTGYLYLFEVFGGPSYILATLSQLSRSLQAHLDKDEERNGSLPIIIKEHFAPCQKNEKQQEQQHLREKGVKVTVRWHPPLHEQYQLYYSTIGNLLKPKRMLCYQGWFLYVTVCHCYWAIPYILLSYNRIVKLKESNQ